ncbi:MAG: hypothetical protein KJ674_04955 [Nanoarchaeota archaeon]|nr:hypothetical protein [Nanoarchaeota archaeon]
MNNFSTDAKGCIDSLLVTIKNLSFFFSICISMHKMSILPNEIWQLKVESGLIIEKLEKTGFKSKKIKETINNLKTLKEKDYNKLWQLLKDKPAQENFIKISDILKEILKNLKKAQNYLKNKENKKVFNTIILIRNELEILRKNFKVDTKEAEVRIWLLEKSFKKNIK